MSPATLLLGLHARYCRTLERVGLTSHRCDGLVTLNMHFRARTAVQFVEAGLVDAATLDRLQANCWDARRAECRDEFGNRQYLLPCFTDEGDEDGLELTRQFDMRDDDAPYLKGMHGVGSQRRFRALWRRIARPPRP